MKSLSDPSIKLDWATGSLEGANWRERAGMALFRLAAVATQSPERPGFSKLAAAIAHIFPSEKFVRVQFPDRSIYQFPYGDGYWSVLCAPGFRYEREIDAFVQRCAREGIDYVFLDCGANFGYWSCRTSSEWGGGQRAIAIEASAESFGHAMRNRNLNDNRFVAHHRAISDRHNEQVTLYGGDKHEQRSLVAKAADAAEVAREVVRSVSLGRLKDLDDAAGRIVLKLDVEGMEISALEGGRKWLDEETLVIFEDHGSDREHSTARAMQEQFGLRIFSGSATGQFTEINDVSDLSAIKTVKRKGYDFFATRSPFWIDFLNRPPAS